MNVNYYFKNPKKLEEKYIFFIAKEQLIERKNTENLIMAHMNKAEHNLKMLNLLTDEFTDWKIISLYYALYHSCLALLANKNYISKNHTATLLFVVKNYVQVSNDELELIDELKLKEDDAKFYTELKDERHTASYSTNLFYDAERNNLLKEKTIKFLNKVKEILEL